MILFLLQTCLTVELQKLDGSFGISLTGGPEIGGIFIRTLLPGGAAEQTGSILVGTAFGYLHDTV